jgi:putative transcriptional regulator
VRWGAGQLEHELTEDNWLMVPVAPDCCSTPSTRWQAAASIGVDLAQVVITAGA